ncbi:MAG: DUF2141 domain-containing protein [Bacteroidales bacterium]|jgi:uncharacterized protein (DUF2141 family)|nr:DUF2141 domain-containing protein [Bacteroidales bacterium]
MRFLKIMLFLCCTPFFVQAQQLKIKIEGIEKIQGQLRIGIFTEKEEFAGENPVIGKVINISNKIETCVFDDLKEGKYAISVYQDLNKNGKLDKNFFGIPTEKYGFSNNPKSRKVPEFKQCSFDFKKEEMLIIIKLQ